tara:strand:+ start:1650 stop:1844 length:195 start_codon:yes stop_codon:yes gene_type:complete
MDSDKKQPTIKIEQTEFCILGDCNQEVCHHCFPVINCKKHKICIKYGCCPLIKINNYLKIINKN